MRTRRHLRGPGRAVLTAVMVAIAFASSVSSAPAQAGGGDERAGGPATIEASSDYFGINAQFLMREVPRALWDRHLSAIAASGITVARDYTRWHMVEKSPPRDGRHSYDWRITDGLAAMLARHGLRWMPIVGFSANWAATTPGEFTHPPRDVASYVAFARAVAERYGRNGQFWRANPQLPQLPVTDYEIWNAPNNPVHWPPAAQPERYMDMYLASRDAIRSIDPEATVWIGGLEGQTASEFLRAMLAHRPAALEQIDAVALHPYGPTPADVVARVRELRATMDALGATDAPISINEIGWTTVAGETGYHASDAQRARFYTTLLHALSRSDCGVASVMPHTWVSAERDPRNPSDWFGIYGPDATPTATSNAYAAAIAELAPYAGGGRGADLAACGRQPAVDVGATRSSRPARAAQGSTRSRQTKRVRRTCHRAKVSLAGSPLTAARVRFTYSERRRGRRKRTTRTRLTNSQGLASVCRTATRRRRPTLVLTRVTARRGDLARHASAAPDGLLLR